MEQVAGCSFIKEDILADNYTTIRPIPNNSIMNWTKEGTNDY